MDAVTAVSGSGPAYVFLLAEALAQAGVAAGLPAPLAAKLARETVAGSGELLHRSPLDAATLRQNVTSPGGTTAAALAVLMGEDGLAALMTTRRRRRDRALARTGRLMPGSVRPPWKRPTLRAYIESQSRLEHLRRRSIETLAAAFSRSSSWLASGPQTRP